MICLDLFGSCSKVKVFGGFVYMIFPRIFLEFVLYQVFSGNVPGYHKFFFCFSKVLLKSGFSADFHFSFRRSS